MNTLTLRVFDVAAILNLNPMRHCIDGASNCWTDGVQLNTPHLLWFNSWNCLLKKRRQETITEHVHSIYHDRMGIPGYCKHGSQALRFSASPFFCIWQFSADGILSMRALHSLIGHIRLAGPRVHSRGQDYKALTRLYWGLPLSFVLRGISSAEALEVRNKNHTAVYPLFCPCTALWRLVCPSHHLKKIFYAVLLSISLVSFWSSFLSPSICSLIPFCWTCLCIWSSKSYFLFYFPGEMFWG